MDFPDCFIFCQDNLVSTSFAVFGDMREKGELLDFRFSVGERSFTGHRLVLAAAIPYFRSVFASIQQEITLQEIDPTVLGCLIDFAYTGKIKIMSENARSLLLASKYLNLAKLYNACNKFLQRCLHINNVWDIRSFGETHDCFELLQSADKFIRENFEEFSKSKSFAVLPFLYLKETANRDDLQVKSEENVYEAVIRWVKSSPHEREDRLPDLLQLVRMPHLSPDYLVEHVCKEELVRSSFLCRDLVEDAKLYHWMPGKRSKIRRFTTRPRIYDKTLRAVTREKTNRERSGVYLICRHVRELSVKLLHPENKKWMSISSYRSDRLHVDIVVAVKEVIYIFLGNTILTFDVKELTWYTLGTFDTSLSSSTAVFYHSRIYFFGGGLSSRKVRCYDPQLNKWQEEERMTRRLKLSGVTCLEQFIYVTGGRYGFKYYKTVERYVPETKLWSEVSPMLSARSDHGCTSFNCKIYVCGGFYLSSKDSSYPVTMETMEIYDSTTDNWSFVCPMKMMSRGLSFVPNNGKIYTVQHKAFFGDSNPAPQIYNPELNECEFLSSEVDPALQGCSGLFLVSAPIPTEHNNANENV